ncbi:hypothetical protein FE810_12255 [Thalassotalea litorea]|uniref:Tetratricopeptide repeat protein n=1 Tax=Thalassotalea litorea TaxID=2020715 RepID=A0A5R9IFQ1_9GAMM|nr:hypothetical protein [Thalassotalea litorea]TLU64365.1 hypothetical protein FE810_12255 [Thalassotalea litorea]
MKRSIYTKVFKLLSTILLVTGALSAPLSAKENRAQKLEEFGALIVNVLNERDAEAFCRQIDFNDLAMRAAKDIFDKKSEQSDYARGFNKSSAQICERVVANLEYAEGKTKFRGIVERDGQKRIVVRFDLGDSGFDYVEYRVKSLNNEYQIFDWYQLTTGQLVSETIGAMSKLMMDPNPGILKKLLDIKTIDKDLSSQMTTMFQAFRDKRFKDVLTAYESLPDPVKYSRIIITYAMAAANHSGDEAKYKGMLSVLAEHHSSDPSAAFMLVDYYYYQGDWDKVLASIDTLESRFGKDAMLELLKANVYWGNGDYLSLEQHAKNAIAMEPDFEDPYFTLAQGYIELEQFENATNIFDLLVNNFGYYFSKEEFAADPSFSIFVASQAFANWAHIHED